MITELSLLSIHNHDPSDNRVIYLQLRDLERDLVSTKIIGLDSKLFSWWVTLSGFPIDKWMLSDQTDYDVDSRRLWEHLGEIWGFCLMDNVRFSGFWLHTALCKWGCSTPFWGIPLCLAYNCPFLVEIFLSFVVEWALSLTVERFRVKPMPSRLSLHLDFNFRWNRW